MAEPRTTLGGTTHPALDGIDLVVFDKDGTLVDFHAMWSGWMVRLAGDLERLTGQPVTSALYGALGFDATAGRALPGHPLAATPMADLRVLTHEALVRAGVPVAGAEAALDAAWTGPDPVALARPLADLPALFGVLRATGRQIAVVTTDDREPTERTLEALGVTGLVDAVVAADDGVPVKPAPDAVLRVAGLLGVAADRTAVVGDALADLAMARAAGARAIAVTSGVSGAMDLAPEADAIVPSVAALAR
ncbi:MAG TPA: HAD family hydrolase [Candidatus Limnocylindrales bacterium]|nr:HAD family hydrolase [Candidatus Limnocylindrales bacterium]